MEKHCVSLDLARKLKEAGFPQVSKFYWCITPVSDWHIIDETGYNCLREDISCTFYSAYFATEILEELPIYVRNKVVCINHLYDKFIVTYVESYSLGGVSMPLYFNENPDEDKSLPNALAKMWLYLKQQNLLQEAK